MNFKDKLLKLKNIALVGFSASQYNEDSMTATELVWQNTKKVRECMQVVAELCDIVNNFVENVNISYNPDQEELVVTLKDKFTQIKNESLNCFVNTYHEDAMTSLELAGRNAQHINECVRLINMMSEACEELTDTIVWEYNENTKSIVTNIGGIDNE